MKKDNYQLSVENSPTLYIQDLLLKPTKFYYVPGTPGKIHGLPETCYPPTNPEIEIEKLLVWDELSKCWCTVPDPLIVWLEDQFTDEFCEQMDEWHKTYFEEITR